MKHHLAGLFGRAEGRRVVIVTKRGVEIPLFQARGWTALELAQELGDIESLPETEERP